MVDDAKKGKEVNMGKQRSRKIKKLRDKPTWKQT